MKDLCYKLVVLYVDRVCQLVLMLIHKTAPKISEMNKWLNLNFLNYKRRLKTDVGV